MKYCPNCGKSVDSKAVICPHCGVALNANNPISNAQNDTGSVGLAIFGFFVPVAGLALYLIWKNSEPKNAHEAGLGALISVCVSAGIIFLIFIIAFIAGVVSSV